MGNDTHIEFPSSIIYQGKTNSLYRFAPVPVLVNSNETLSIDKEKIEIVSIPENIKYSITGLNPQYNDEPIIVKYKNKILNIETKNNLLSLEKDPNENQ